LGLVLALPALLRGGAPMPALACVAGLLFLSTAAALLGRLTHGSRTFLALFLFALYLDLQKTGVAGLDLLGLGGDASAFSALGYACAGALGFAALVALPRWRGV
jgi:hypothetical protein